MTLRAIPTEEGAEEPQDKKQKKFNPAGNLKNLKKEQPHDGSLKTICMRIVHFINRGSKHTYEQLDELIMTMQRSILSLQKKKQEILRQKNKPFHKKPGKR